MIHSLIGAGLVLLTLLALGFCLALGIGRSQATGKPRRNRTLEAMWNTAPSFSTTAYDPNAETHKGGRISKVADAAITVRWLLVTFGVTTASVKVNPITGSTGPIGVVDDTTDTLTNDLTIPLNVNLLGGCDCTLKVAINSTVTQGDFLIQDTTTAGYAMTDPATSGVKVYQIGRALQSGVAGGVVEFIPIPMVVQH